MRQLWADALRIDPTLAATRRQLAALPRRRIRPVAFSRAALFGAMDRGEPILFSDFPVRVRGERERGTRGAVLHALRTGLPDEGTIRVRCGASATQKYVTRDELIRRWESGRSKVSVTDLHIRGSNVARRIDCSRLSDFNLLARAGGDVGAEEMLTLVMSSAGTFTDSHSDDPDGSNHCFTGKKLWLVWDTFRGLSRNLEDVERCEVEAPQAAFNIAAFLSIRGSRWFTVEAGQTLFLPGHLTHKVVTLEDYIGVGSFFVMLPSYLRTVERWTRHSPLWSLGAPSAQRLALVDDITRRVTQKVRLLARAPAREKSCWGLAPLVQAVDCWMQGPSRARSVLLDRPVSAQFVDAVLASSRRVSTQASSARQLSARA